MVWAHRLQYFDQILTKEFGVSAIKTSFKSPWQQGKVERFHLSLKTEIFSRLPIADVVQVQQLCREYQNLYNFDRTHQALKGRFPNTKETNLPSEPIRIVQKCHMVGGLVTIFRRVA